MLINFTCLYIALFVMYLSLTLFGVYLSQAQSCSRYITGSPAPTTALTISPLPSPYKALSNCLFVIETAPDRQAFVTVRCQ